MAQLVEALHYKPEGRGFDFSLYSSLGPHYGPGDDSAFYKNEYRGHMLVVKAAGALG